MRGWQLSIALVALWATLAVASAQQATEEAAAPINPNPLSSLSLDSLEATRSAPLFTPSRTPPPVEEPVGEVQAAAPIAPQRTPEAPPPPVQLVGIVLTDSTQTAILRDSGTGEIHRLASGDTVGDWSLKIVDARSVELHNGERVQAMKMFETFGSPPAMDGEQTEEPFDGGQHSEMNSAPQSEGMQRETGSGSSSPDTDSSPADGDPSDVDTAPTESSDADSSDGDADHAPTDASPEADSSNGGFQPDPNSSSSDPAVDPNFKPELGHGPIPDDGTPLGGNPNVDQ